MYPYVSLCVCLCVLQCVAVCLKDALVGGGACYRVTVTRQHVCVGVCACMRVKHMCMNISI